MNTFVHDYIPARWRKIIYGVLGTVVAVETTLDASGVGVVPDKWQDVALSVAVVLGFGMAFTQTTDITVVADESESYEF